LQCNTFPIRNYVAGEVVKGNIDLQSWGRIIGAYTGYEVVENDQPDI
jgi:hypothetical protein